MSVNRLPTACCLLLSSIIFSFDSSEYSPVVTLWFAFCLTLPCNPHSPLFILHYVFTLNLTTLENSLVAVVTLREW